MTKKAPKKKAPRTIDLLDAQAERLENLAIAVDRAQMSLASCRGRLDLYIASIRDAHGVSDSLPAVKVEGSQITFSEEHESNVSNG